MGSEPSLSFNFLTKHALNYFSFRKQRSKVICANQIRCICWCSTIKIKKGMHCVLSGSDVWRKLGLLCSSLSNNKTPALLTRYCCCYSSSNAEKMTDFLQLDEGGNMLIRDSQWSWEGPKQYDIILV